MASTWSNVRFVCQVEQTRRAMNDRVPTMTPAHRIRETV